MALSPPNMRAMILTATPREAGVVAGQRQDKAPEATGFLNRVSQVRILPGALPDQAKHAAKHPDRVGTLCPTESCPVPVFSTVYERPTREMILVCAGSLG